MKRTQNEDDGGAPFARADARTKRGSGDGADETSGIALCCARDGGILDILRDDYAVLEQVEREQRDGDAIPRRRPSGPAAASYSLADIVDRGSREKAERFIEQIKRSGTVFDWELNIPHGHGAITLHFAGCAIEERLIVVAATTSDGVYRLYEELAMMQNEQANRLRAVEKECSTLRSKRNTSEGSAALYNEITELNNQLQNLSRTLQKKNAQLERLNELKNQFLGMATHDLRKPLSVILTFSELLYEDLEGAADDELVEFVERILSNCMRMKGMIDDFLDIAVIESGQLQLTPHRLDPVALASDCVELGRIQAEKKEIEITMDAGEDMVPLIADGQKLEQAIMNLIGNAVEFSQPGSKVTLKLTHIHEGGDHKGDHKGDGEGAGSVQIAVKDEGEGIAPEALETLFEPFSKGGAVKTAGESSTGLGLVITKKIVDAHGGSITVESTLGEGSTFTVTLPVECPMSSDVKARTERGR